MGKVGLAVAFVVVVISLSMAEGATPNQLLGTWKLQARPTKTITFSPDGTVLANYDNDKGRRWAMKLPEMTDEDYKYWFDGEKICKIEPKPRMIRPGKQGGRR